MQAQNRAGAQPGRAEVRMFKRQGYISREQIGNFPAGDEGNNHMAVRANRFSETDRRAKLRCGRVVEWKRHEDDLTAGQMVCRRWHGKVRVLRVENRRVDSLTRHAATRLRADRLQRRLVRLAKRRLSAAGSPAVSPENRARALFRQNVPATSSYLVKLAVPRQKARHFLCIDSVRYLASPRLCCLMFFAPATRLSGS